MKIAKQTLIAYSLAVILTLGLVASATATLVVQNPGFEFPAVESFPGGSDGDIQFVDSPPTSWTFVGATPSAQFIVRFPNYNPYLPTPVPDGDQAMLLTGSGGALVYQNLGTVDITARLTLSVRVAERIEATPNPLSYTLELLADTDLSGTLTVGDTVIAAATNPVIPTSTSWQIASTSQSAYQNTGTRIFARISVPNTGSILDQTAFDSVTLSQQLIPEPSTVFLLAVDGATLVWRLRR